MAIYPSRIIIFVQTGCLFQLKQDPENSLPSPCIPHGYDQATMLGFSWVQWRAFMRLKLETRLKSSNKKTYIPNNKYDLHIHTVIYIICINITLYYPSRHSPNYDVYIQNNLNSHLHLPQVAQWLIRQGGITREQLAMVSVLMSRQAARHPEALTRKAHTLEEVGIIVLGNGWATAWREVAKSWVFHFCGFEWI